MTRPQRLPPIHALAAFESAARLGGFGQAATELCITPSAVSHRIRILELQLGEPLFERRPTGVRLTNAGQRYLSGVREAFARLAHLSRSDAVANPRLRVGSPPTFARNMLIPHLPEFYSRRPDVQIEVAVVMPMQDRPERHDVDIRFGNGRFDGRETIKLFDDELQVLATPRYAKRRRLARPADLKDAELLRSPLIPWRPWFAAAGLDSPEPTGGLAFTDLGILLEAAASELGVALCLQRVAAPWTGSGQLVPLFGISAPAASTYHVLVERDQTERPEVASFVDWLTATFA